MKPEISSSNKSTVSASLSENPTDPKSSNEASKANSAGQPKERKKISRLRTGCWTCRRRGYKCDEGKPYCYNCIRLNLACEGYGIRLKWQDDWYFRHNKGKGKSASDTKSKSSSGRNSDSYSLTNENSPVTTMAPLIPQSDQFHVQQQAFPISSMFESDLNSMPPHHTLTQIPSNSSILPPVSNIQSYSQPFRQPPSYSSQQQLPPALAFQTPFTAHPYFNKSLQLQGFQAPFNKDNSNNYQQSPEIPPPASTLDQEELLQICLRHFHLFKESRIPVLLPDTSFFSVVSQYIPLHEPLANAVASLAARNLSQLEGSYVQTAVDFKIKALNFLRHDLESRGVSKYSIVCMLILANIELNEGSIESWAQHLDGAAKGVAEILANNRVFETPENYKDFLVLLDALAYHDIVSCLSQCIRPRLHDVYARPWRNLKLKTSDYYYGMRQNMVNLSDIICLVADIYETSTNSPYTRYPASENGISKPPSSRYYCVSRSYYTPRQLQTYNQLLKNISDLDPTADVPSDVTKLAVCGKFGILLYFILKLDADEFMHKLSSRIRDIKTQGLRSLSSLPLLYSTATIQAFLTWLIGIVCEIQSERAIVMNRIQELYKNVPRMSLYSVMNFLTIFWKYRDSPAYDNYTYRNLLMLVTDQTGFQIMV